MDFKNIFEDTSCRKSQNLAIVSSKENKNKHLVSDFENAMNLLKDVRPGVLSPDEEEHLIVDHRQDHALHISSHESGIR